MNDTRKVWAWIKPIAFIGILAIAVIIMAVKHNNNVKQAKLAAERQAEMARLARERAEKAAEEQRIKEEEEAREKLRKERERREQEEAARRKAESELVRKAAEAEAERQRLAAAAAKRRQAYQAARSHFQSTLDMEENAPTGEKMKTAKTGSRFWCILASDAADKPIYEIEKVSPGRLKIKAISSETDAKEVPYADFNRMLDTATYAYTSGGKVWLKCAKSPAGRYFVPERGRNFCLAASVLGTMHKTLAEFGTKLDDVKFRFSLQSSNGKKIIPLGPVGFGETLPRSKIEEAIGQQIGRKASAAVAGTGTDQSKKPVFKRTVVLYNGNVIKKEITGVTKVPMTFYFHTPAKIEKLMQSGKRGSKAVHKDVLEHEKKKEYARRKWKELYDEAKHQEKEERLFYANYAATQAAEKGKTDELKEMAARMSKDDVLINAALEKYNLVVEEDKKKPQKGQSSK